MSITFRRIQPHWPHWESDKMEKFHHLPVLAEEVINLLNPKPGGTYLDCTVGGGGHSALILEKMNGKGMLIGLDRDRTALEAAGKRLQQSGSNFLTLHGCFADLGQILATLEIREVDGILMDLGVSSHQLDSAERGFSFRFDAPLDMRMDNQQGETAAQLLNRASQKELEQIIRDFGEERFYASIARRIVQERQEKMIVNTMQLAKLVAESIPRRFHEERIDPATRTFQALRIAVNDELEQVKNGVKSGIAHLKPGGRIAVISFHSLEDRIVKQIFRDEANGCICPPRLPVCRCNKIPAVKIVTRRPVTATAEEIAANPRSRSAKLRVAERLPSVEKRRG